MRASWKHRLVGCVALTVMIATCHTIEATSPVVDLVRFSSIQVGQADSPVVVNRREAGKWLAYARQAMQTGNFPLAEDYLQRAQRLNPQYDRLTSRFEDTPAKVAADLAKLRNGARPTGAPVKAATVQRPGITPPTDPYSVGSQQATLERLADQSKAQAVSAMQNARSAMQAGDFAGAIGWYQSAVGAGAKFATNEYQPFHLAQELQKAGVDPKQLTPPVLRTTRMLDPTKLAAMPADRVQAMGGATATGASNNAFRAALVNNPEQLGTAQAVNSDSRAEQGRLLWTARRFLAQGKIDQATEWVQKAKRMKIASFPNMDSPDRVEQLITRYKEFSVRSASVLNQDRYKHDFAEFLLQQSDGVLAYRDFASAKQLGDQARMIGARFVANERNPAQMLQKIAQQQDAAQSQAAQGAPSKAASNPKAQVTRFLGLAMAALNRGDLAGARQMTVQAERYNLPAAAFAVNEMQPWQMHRQIDRVAQGNSRAVRRAGYDEKTPQAGQQATGQPASAVQQGLYRPDQDATRTVVAQNTTGPATELQPVAENPGMRLYAAGLQALDQQQTAKALDFFRQAWQHEQQLDALTRQRLQEKLTLLSVTQRINEEQADDSSPLAQMDNRQQLLRQKVLREITAAQRRAEEVQQKDPRAALQELLQLHEHVEKTELDDASKRRLLKIVNRSVAEMEKHIAENLFDIELDERNAAILDEIEAERQELADTRNRIGELVDQFNELIDERRYAEAEVLARQARELAPEEPVVQTLVWKSRFVKRIGDQVANSELKEQGFIDALFSVDQASRPFDDRNPIVFDEAKNWEELTLRRRNLLKRQQGRLTPTGVEIQQSLKKHVDVNFNETPLSVVVDTLGRMTGINVHLDRRGMAAEGVTSDTPVTIALSQPVSLQSALNLILEELRLSYVIRNEVLLITSEQTRDTDVYQEVYNVADLVIGIPNFVPGSEFGLPAAIRNAHNRVANGMVPGASSGIPLTMAADSMNRGTGNASILAQMGATGMIPGGSRGSARNGVSMGSGGAAMADFDSLIELIQSTIAPDTWEEVGGAGTISEFRGNLSLVISQTQEVHEEIADLLEQLRRLQDLQITIEVRFITLNDNFFERIGIDFDFEIDDNVNVDDIGDDRGPSVLFGLDQQGPTVDLDLVFNQGDAYNAAMPMFGGFDAGSAANFGFALLSDIEVFFLLQVAQGDTRSNVLTAPKVTLFDGQQASVSDTSQRPFVTGVQPVVGDFAAAHMPIIVVLNEGTSLNVQAVVSNDRRFVRLTLVPFFSQIGEVEEFTFNGKTTTSTGQTVFDANGEAQAQDFAVKTTEGTTVQLPTFSFTTVSTTVSVPDGGTVLLGGIKRLQEGRTERGVPILAQLPYINRLFKNVGIGRQTQSLMMMVTPRIIIQEEEELAQTGLDSSQN
ncbi:MAG: hypothetical protein VB912_08670 [Pirellulaceae bacterium]